LTFHRGAIWYAEIPHVGDKPVAIVSADFINLALRNVTVARITSVERDRALPTFVAVEPGEVAGLPARSFVVCHDLFTLPKSVFRRHVGTLPARRLLEVEVALRRALDL
jgi:mRNA interferase MazF